MSYTQPQISQVSKTTRIEAASAGVAISPESRSWMLAGDVAIDWNRGGDELAEHTGFSKAA